MAVTANDVLKIAKAWLGANEVDGSFKQIIDVYNSYSPKARGYTLKYTDEWCDGFVSACAIKAGAVDIIGTEVGVPKHVQIFKNKGVWIGKVKPKAGDVIVFDWDGNGSGDHIGYVEKVSGNNVTTIEGNMSEKVGRRTIAWNHSQILGFARPKYAAETASTPKKKTNYEIADEVIEGKWGVGQERYDNLTKAGYDYDAVQSIVNDKLKVKPKKTNEQLADEVLAGKWGVGQARCDSLTKAGYDYDAIQAIVNKKVSAKRTQKIVLPASAKTWIVYPLNVKPVVGNECGKLTPSAFGGLTYDVIKWTQQNVAVINTADYGTVQIYVAPDTGAIIKK